MDSSLNMALKCAYLCKELIRYYTIHGSNVSIELIIIRCFLSCVYLEYPNISSPYYVTGIVIKRYVFDWEMCNQNSSLSQMA